jgi:hypothetical protein
VFSLDLSTPAGKTIFDDYKIKAGGQLRICNYKNMQLAVKINGITRRLNSEMVKALNLGVETGLSLGYYKPKWFLAAEAGYDKTVVTRLQHTHLVKENYAAVVDGWYASTVVIFIMVCKPVFLASKWMYILKVEK